MHNLRTRIKRRKEALRKTQYQEGSSSSSKSSSVEADWQFVNFNPCMYGPRKSLESSDSFSITVTDTLSSSLTNIASTAGDIAVATALVSSSNNGNDTSESAKPSRNVGRSTEDFYEFPSSTNLKNIISPSSGSSNGGSSNPRTQNFVQLKNHPSSSVNAACSITPNATRSKADGSVHSPRDSHLRIHSRHSITSTFDLLPNPIQIQGQSSTHHLWKNQSNSQHVVEDEIDSDIASNRAKSTDSVTAIISKSNSALSTASSSSSVSTPSSKPVSRSSSGVTPSSQSKFYIPSPSHSSRPPLPLPPRGGSTRPHSWDVDSATNTLVINGRDLIFVKKPSNGNNIDGRNPCSNSKSNSKSSHTNKNEGFDEANVKRKRHSYSEQVHRKSPSHSPSKLHHNVSKTAPHPPPLPLYSLEHGMVAKGFPPATNQSRKFRPPPPLPSGVLNNFSAVGSLCLSVINPNHACDRPLTGSGSSAGNLKGDRRPDTLSEERLENDGLVCDDEEMNSVRHEPKKTTNAVGRSESCKEPQRKQPRERRKHSDPNLTSKSSDVDLDNQRHLSDPNHSGSSSNSSLSARSLDRDSPNTSSIELVTTAHQPYFRRDRDSETPDNLVRHSDNLCEIPPGWDGDSDIEIEQDAPDWTKDVPEETLSRLDRLGKKRQEVLNELFHTERLYVRKLKIMDRLFSRPIRNQQLLSTEMINLLFPNLEEILNIHDQFNASMKKKRTENPLVGDIGPVLLEMFDGERGEQLKHAASTFCARQQIGLELLREKRKRDMKFHAFLTEAESNPVCRRLGIKDMIPTVMQRLTKYPLLFESLCNCTAADSIEYKNLQRALELSKEILCSVNYAKKEAEDEERLSEIQRKLDKSFFEKGVERTDLDLRNFDFTRHKLIHDGYLMWKVQKMKGDRPKSEHQEVLLVLLEEMVVLLLKIDDRYVLKMHNIGSGRAERMPARPIIRLHTLHATRAADKKALYLISKTLHTPFMFELVCSTAEERNMWLQHITRATDDYKSRQESRRNEVQPIGNIPPSVPDSEDRNKDSSEVAESGGAESNDQATDTSSGVQPEAGLSTKDSRPPTLDTNSPSTNPATQSPESPEKGVAGDGGKLSVGDKEGQSSSTSQSPAPRRSKGEFLRVTESTPLIDPSEVVVETTEVHFAKVYCSPHEELKRCDAQIHMAFDEKLKIISKLCHIPPEEDIPKEDSADSSPDSTEKPKDAKELVAACIHQVDQLGRLITTQKMTSENLQLQKDQLGIHKVLNGLLAQLLSEVHRKDEDLELRRQELYRIREQNHGYQARLQAKTKAEHQQASLVSPVRSPTHSRPNSFVSLSSASDHHDYTHEDETEIVGRAPLKPQLSAPVASSSSNSTSPPSSALPAGDAGSFSTTTTSACDNLTTAKPGESRRILAKDVQRKSSSELAHEEFADALEDWDSGVETNRESTETEVIAPTNEIVSSDQQDVEEEEGCSKEKLVEGEISQVPSTNDNESYNVPENGELSGLESTKSMTTTSSATSAEDEHNQGLTANSASDDSLINGHQEHIPAESSKSINNSSGEEISNNGKCNSIEVQDGEAQEKTQQR